MKSDERIAQLRGFLLAESDAVGREAAHALGKIGPAARVAADDLYAAATLPWKFGCPQRFAPAIDALVRVAPDDPRIVPLIQDTVCCSNYGVQKACVFALLALRTPEATDALYHLDRYWRASPRTHPFKELMARTLEELARRDPGGERAADRERLAHWAESPTGNGRRSRKGAGTLA